MSIKRCVKKKDLKKKDQPAFWLYTSGGRPDHYICRMTPPHSDMVSYTGMLFAFRYIFVRSVAWAPFLSALQKNSHVGRFRAISSERGFILGSTWSTIIQQNRFFAIVIKGKLRILDCKVTVWAGLNPTCSNGTFICTMFPLLSPCRHIETKQTQVASCWVEPSLVRAVHREVSCGFVFWRVLPDVTVVGSLTWAIHTLESYPESCPQVLPLKK